MKVGRIQVKFDSVPFDNVANKFDDDDDDDEVFDDSGNGGGRGGGGAKNGYWKRLISTDEGGQEIFGGRTSEGCHARLTGKAGGANGVLWSIRWVFPFDGEIEADDDDDDRSRFKDGDVESFRVIPLDLIFGPVEEDVVGRRNGNINFRRFASFNWCSDLLVPFFFSED